MIISTSIRASGLGLLLAASLGHAQPAADYGPFPYDYAFANIALTDLDTGGAEIGGSWEVINRVIVFGSYQSWDLSVTELDRTSYRVGGGYRWDLGPNLDFVAKVAFANTEIEQPGADQDDDGLVVSGLFRSWLARDVEFTGELMLDDSLGSSIETVLEVGGQYYLGRNFSVGGRIRVDEEDTVIFLGGRFLFGASARRRSLPPPP